MGGDGKEGSVNEDLGKRKDDCWWILSAFRLDDSGNSMIDSS